MDNYENWKALDLAEHRIRYMIYQWEQSKEKTDHLQGYIEFVAPMALTTVKRVLKDPKMHLERRNGTQAEALEYCRKNDSMIRPHVELGTPARAGRRTDIEEVYNMVMDGKSNLEIAELAPGMYMKYYNAIDKVRANTASKQAGKWRDTHVTVLWGEPGVGKTRSVYDNNPEGSVYEISSANTINDRVWLDNYTNQNVLLIDEFDDNVLPINTLLNLLEGRIRHWQVKGAFIWGMWSKVYITSDVHPSGWYPHIPSIKRRAMQRRIDVVTHCVSPDPDYIPRMWAETTQVMPKTYFT